LLVSALLVIPAAAALQVARSFKEALAVAAFLAGISALAGLVISFILTGRLPEQSCPFPEYSSSSFIRCVLIAKIEGKRPPHPLLSRQGRGEHNETQGEGPPWKKESP